MLIKHLMMLHQHRTVSPGLSWTPALPRLFCGTCKVVITPRLLLVFQGGRKSVRREVQYNGKSNKIKDQAKTQRERQNKATGDNTRGDTRSDCRGNTLREDKTRERDKNTGTPEELVLSWGFQGEALPGFPSCFTAPSQLQGD